MCQKNTLITALVMCVCSLYLLLPVECSTGNPTKPVKDMIYATGEGAIPNSKEQPNRAKAYLQAKAYAKMQAIASLVQSAKGTLIEYQSNGRNYMADTQIKQQINGVLDSVQVVSVSKRSVEKDIIVAVTVRAPRPIPPKPQAEPQLPKPSVPAQAACGPTWLYPDSQKNRAISSDCYTSLILDAQGLGVDRSMSPKILRSDRSELWGTMKSDIDFLNDYGIAAYATNRAEAIANCRAGQKPLIIRALKSNSMSSPGDVTISDSDANLIREEDRKSHFLDDFRVIIIVDKPTNIAGLKAR